jgi:alpha-L-fucosidase 2
MKFARCGSSSDGKSLHFGSSANSDHFTADQTKISCVTPARDWREALPLSNGCLGALVFGRTASEVVALNHEGLWGGGCSPEMPDVSDALPDVRDALAAGKYQEAENILPQRLKQAGYTDASSGAFMPGPDLLIHSGSEYGYGDYLRTLDLANGEVTITWMDGRTPRMRRCFTSVGDAMFVYDCGVLRGNPSRHVLRLEPHDLRDTFLVGPIRTFLSPEVKRHIFREGAGVEVDLGNGCRYIAAFHVRGGSNILHEQGSLACDLGPDGLIFCAVEPMDGAHGGDVTSLYDRLAGHHESYEELLGRSRPAHVNLMAGLQFELGCDHEDRSLSNEELLLKAFSGRLPNALVEKLFHYGRYLLASSSRPGSLPAHLQGKWNGEYAPPWNCAYFNNENLQMTYWQAMPGNMEGALLPVFDLYESLMDHFRENARKLFGCRGILLPLFNSPFNGRQTDLQPHVLYWTGAGAWLAQLYWEYWIFTRDQDFLARRAVPFMREVARFYLDFLQAGPDGKAVMSPGNSPENRALPHLTSVCVNATMDFALAREVFTNLLSASEELGLNEPEAPDWRRALASLPDYQVDETGALREWLHADFGENHQHRHISHIYPFFPGCEIPPDPGHPLFKAVHNAVLQRMTIGLSEQTGWSLTHLANIFGRLGEGERAWQCLAHLAQSCVGNSLLTYHNDTRGMGVTMDFRWGLSAPLQLDAIFGFPAAVMEMLLYSSETEIRLFPALPKAWARGSFAGWQTRCGVEVSCRWNIADRDFCVELRAKRSTAFVLKINSPSFGTFEQELLLDAGESRTIGREVDSIAATPATEEAPLAV